MTAPVLERPRYTPSKWANRAMTLMLKTPGIQRVVGATTALLTYTGRRSGQPVTMPVSYIRKDNRLILTGHRTRVWWRNLEVNPEVTLRLAGKTVNGYARVSVADEDTLGYLTEFLEAQPVVARMAGVAIDESGKADLEDVRAVNSYTAVVVVDLVEQ